MNELLSNEQKRRKFIVKEISIWFFSPIHSLCDLYYHFARHLKQLREKYGQVE